MSDGEFHNVVPTDAEIDRARGLHNQGYFQLSRKYRKVSRPYGANYDPYDNGCVPPFSYDGWQNDVVELTPGEFKAFFEMRDAFDRLLSMKYAREDGARHQLLEIARLKYHHAPAQCEAFVEGALMVLREQP